MTVRDLDVRCPTCNAWPGRWCYERVDRDGKWRGKDPRPHPGRVRRRKARVLRAEVDALPPMPTGLGVIRSARRPPARG